MAYEEGSEADRRRSEQVDEVQATWQGMSLREFRLLSEDELVRRHDILMDPDIGIGSLGPDDYVAELNRRAADRQTTWLVRLTWVIAALTIVITVATVALLVRGE